ncbi:LTA synthase family protein [Collinsella bouchesdurhonensis]|uniref:LTA synthase family protein n=1 Tax=Collinsella bouchesdurhonensis TaxID=1907654 RepID=UPI0035614345
METEAPTTMAANAGPAISALVLILFATAAWQAWQFWRHRRIEVTTLLWQLPFVGLLGFIIYWTGQGFVEDWTADTGNASAMVGLAWTAGICGLVPLLRGPVARLIDVTKVPMRLLATTLRDAVCILVAATLSFRALEMAWNSNVDLLPWSSVAFSVALITAFMAVAYFAFLRRGAGPALVAVVCTVVDVAQHFILEFKGTAILPSDLLALGTAAAVSAGYKCILVPTCLDALGLLCIALAVLSLVRPVKLPMTGVAEGDPSQKDSSTPDASRPPLRMTHRAITPEAFLSLVSRRRWNIVAAAISVVLAIACGNGIQGWFASNQVADALEISFDNWQPINTYTSRGWIPSFSIMVQNLAIPKPNDYTTESAQAAEEELAARYDSARGASAERAAAAAQFDAEKPTVIAIMNETFADLSIFNGLNTGYTGPTYYNNFAGALQRGSLAVSVLGGGTCNTEFEFLTGNSLGFIGGNKYPYTLYDFSNVASLPQQFKELGYTTTAMHPQNPVNWNRSTVYQAMGFDEFLSDADFSGQEGAWGLHSGLSDASTYDRIIQMLNENAEPQFIFDVTIQNHGGYDAIDIPEDYLVPGATDALAEDAALQTRATEYLGLINASDQALESFLTQLTQLDRKVAVVFFGDHQPGFTGAINDMIFPGEDELTHNTRLYETTYFMWTNYEVAGTDIDGVVDGIDGTAADEAAADDTTWTTAGASTLAAQLLDRIGAPLTLYQRAQLGATQEVTAVSLNGYLGADGTWYELDNTESLYATTVDKWRRVQYLEFAERVS